MLYFRMNLFTFYSLLTKYQLILTLYNPNPPELVSHAQTVLHRIQRSPQGWKVAQDLLARPDDKVKFFGALTLIVKLNTERHILYSKPLCTT
jgi:hypothetical protein